MKKILSLMFTLLLFTSLVSAEEVFQIVEAEDIVVAGVTPDSFWYSTEMAIERFTELFGEKIQLAHAKERLAEMKLMIAEGKLNESQVAMENFDNIYKRIRNKERLIEHKSLKDNLGSKISMIASKGKITESDRQDIKSLIFQHKENIREENIKIISEDKGINETEAIKVFNLEQLKIQNKVDEKVSNRFIRANN